MMSEVGVKRGEGDGHRGEIERREVKLCFQAEDADAKKVLEPQPWLQFHRRRRTRRKHRSLYKIFGVQPRLQFQRRRRTRRKHRSLHKILGVQPRLHPGRMSSQRLDNQLSNMQQQQTSSAYDVQKNPSSSSCLAPQQKNPSSQQMNEPWGVHMTLAYDIQKNPSSSSCLCLAPQQKNPSSQQMNEPWGVHRTLAYDVQKNPSSSSCLCLAPQQKNPSSQQMNEPWEVHRTFENVAPESLRSSEGVIPDGILTDLENEVQQHGMPEVQSWNEVEQQNPSSSSCSALVQKNPSSSSPFVQKNPTLSSLAVQPSCSAVVQKNPSSSLCLALGQKNPSSFPPSGQKNPSSLSLAGQKNELHGPQLMGNKLFPQNIDQQQTSLIYDDAPESLYVNHAGFEEGVIAILGKISEDIWDKFFKDCEEDSKKNPSSKQMNELLEKQLERPQPLDNQLSNIQQQQTSSAYDVQKNRSSSSCLHQNPSSKRMNEPAEAHHMALDNVPAELLQGSVVDILDGIPLDLEDGEDGDAPLDLSKFPPMEFVP